MFRNLLKRSRTCDPLKDVSEVIFDKKPELLSESHCIINNLGTEIRAFCEFRHLFYLRLTNSLTIQSKS